MGQGVGAPTALIRKAIFQNFVEYYIIKSILYSRYGYNMKALGLKIEMKIQSDFRHALKS